MLFSQVTGGQIKRNKVVISPDLADSMLISWSNQKDLGVLHYNWLQVLQGKDPETKEKIRRQSCL